MSRDAKIKALHTQWDEISVAQARSRSSYKWSPYADTDMIAAWVADMDLPASAPIADAIAAFYREGDLGYYDESVYRQVRLTATERFARNLQWRVEPDEIELVSDIVQALHLTVEHYSFPGDRIAMITPVYHHFFNATIEQGRTPAPIPLEVADTGYRLDLNVVREVLSKARTRVLLLCHPHNPTGKVFTLEELRGIGEIAQEYGVVVVSDEIHADLTYVIQDFVPFAVATEGLGVQTVTLTSGGKAFNIAGTHLGMMIYSGAEMRRTAPAFPTRAAGKPGIAGCIATQVAWTSEEYWLCAARAYLKNNRDYFIESLNREVPELGAPLPEATYLAWLDFSAFTDDAHAFVEQQARIVTSGGGDFAWPRGTGKQFARVNFATSFPVVQSITERLIDALTRNPAQGRKQ